MNTSRTLLLSLCFCLIPAGVLAADLDSPCRQKEARVLEQRHYAEEYGDEERMRGLNRALAEIRQHCSSTDLIADAEEDVRDALEDVEESRQDLAEALADGDRDDIIEQRQELEEATADLDEKTRHLESLQRQR